MHIMDDDQPSKNCTAENLPLCKFYPSVIVEFFLALPLNLSVLYLLIFKMKFCIAFLTGISVDPYFNVVHPGKNNFLKVFKKAPHIPVIVWLLLLPLNIPTMLKTFECCNSYGRKMTLVEDITDTLREVVFFIQILIPFFVLVYCTVHNVNRLKKKQGIGPIVLVFSFYFLPCTIATMVLLIVRVENLPRAEDIAVFDGLMVLSYMDCLVDPIVYCLSSTKFKSLDLTMYCPCLKIGESQNSSGNNSNPKRSNNVTQHSR
uniref:G-protein coupled receptors family 1 profile domain-containing protein n=1 Tax=Hucho hucho TaxID=62062 RepID=A0A4W5NLS5_9TELE